MVKLPLLRPISRVIFGAFVATGTFIFLSYILPIKLFISILNGVFAGTMAALIVAYWRLLLNALLGVRPYDRVRQMTLGFVIAWMAYGIGVLVSIYLQSSGFDQRASMMVAFSRYVAIIAAVLQVTAPDFGLGLFHGRERKTLWTGIVLGLTVASIVTLMQGNEVLENTPLSYTENPEGEPETGREVFRRLTRQMD